MPFCFVGCFFFFVILVRLMLLLLKLFPAKSVGLVMLLIICACKESYFLSFNF